MNKQWVQSLLRLVVAFLIGLVISSIFIIAVGENPFAAYRELMLGAFSGTLEIFTTLRWTVPYIIVGIGAAVSFKAGLFNMGLEGCVYCGALAAGLLGTIKGLPSIVHIPLCMFGAFLVGSLWMLVPAYLKARRGSQRGHHHLDAELCHGAAVLLPGDGVFPAAGGCVLRCPAGAYAHDRGVRPAERAPGAL